MINNFKNILVTGGMGFIGSNFLKLLLSKGNINITVIDNLTEGSCLTNLSSDIHKLINFEKCSIGDNRCKSILKENNIECVINFAAQTHVDRSIKDPEFFFKNNVLDTIRFIENCRDYFNEKSNYHFHHVSTDEVYGSLDLNQNGFTESSPLRPSNPYSASKASIDLYLQSIKKTFGFKYTTSFCSNNFGPNQMKEKFIPSVIESLKKKKKVLVYGDGSNIRDWIYVDDHCDGIFTIINSGITGENFNIGGKNELTNIELVEKIFKIMFPKKNLSHTNYVEFIEDRKGHDFRYAVCNEKIERLLKWRSNRNFHEDLTQTVNSYL